MTQPHMPSLRRQLRGPSTTRVASLQVWMLPTWGWQIMQSWAQDSHVQ